MVARSPTSTRRWLSLGLVAVALLGIAPGCHPRPPVAAGEVEEPPLPAVPVTDAEFARRVHALLRDGTPTRERSAMLAGAVQRQLAHGAVLFERGDDLRGTNAVVGALYLLRIGEARPDMFDGQSQAALAGAVKRFSARGDEGRALALMLMQRELLAPGTEARAEVEQHLASLRGWMDETRTGGDMSRLAADERAAIGRSLLDPSEESLGEAKQAIEQWIDRAVTYNLEYQRTRKLPPRAEIGEAYRALESGAETMAAVYLRHGLAARALTVIEKGSAGRVTNPAFFARLRAAAMRDAAEDWRDLARDFARIAYGDDEAPLDRALVEAALWGISLEAYRRDPSSQAIAHLLVDQLMLLELPEVTPLVLADALGDEPAAVAVNGALEKIGDALSLQYESPSPATARRVFQAASGLLTLADQPRYAAKLSPSPDQLRQLMASIELRTGHADAALPLLRQALRARPTVQGLVVLAALERQLGEHETALHHAQAAAGLPSAKIRTVDAAEAKLLAFEIHRERGEGEAALAALEDALLIALQSRRGGTPSRQARAERVLGRVLDGFGAHDQATRAFARALDVARTHRPLLGETVLGAMGRALTYDDVDAARAAFHVGVRAELDLNELVYAALWLRLLQQAHGREGGGQANEVLSDASELPGWVGTLARWGRGEIDDEALRRAAGRHGERVEAEFYIAMKARADGASSGEESLRRVAGDPLIDLMEVQIARELLAPRDKHAVPERFELP